VLNLLIRSSAIALACALLMSSAQGAESENAQSAGDISHKRNQACKGLKGAAMEQCMNDYVGPEAGSRYGRDSVYGGKRDGSHPKPFKGRGEWTKPGRS
jgi:hypothetical protein